MWGQRGAASPGWGSNLLPNQNPPPLSTVCRALIGHGSDGEGAPIQLVETDLVSSCIGLVPRDIHVMDHLLGVHRVGPGVRYHGPMQLHPLLGGPGAGEGVEASAR